MKNTRNILLKSLMIGALVSGFGSLAYADNDVAKYEKLTTSASKKISEAISAAEKHVSGVAISAELDSKLGKTIYEIEVLAKGALYDVDVDANSGKVLNSRQDND